MADIEKGLFLRVASGIDSASVPFPEDEGSVYVRILSPASVVAYVRKKSGGAPEIGPPLKKIVYAGLVAKKSFVIT